MSRKLAKKIAEKLPKKLKGKLYTERNIWDYAQETVSVLVKLPNSKELELRWTYWWDTDTPTFEVIR